MSAKHTPGPWEIERGCSTIIKSIGPCVPDEYAGSAWLEVSEADARLIAAAPVLLQFARSVVSYAGSAGDDYLADKARAVIAKAIGDTK